MTESTLPSPRSRLAALIAEARRRGRRRNLALALIGAALVVGGGIWGGLALSGGGGVAAAHVPPGFHLVRAQGPVAHQILETWDSFQPISLDLSTGTGRPVRTTRETWYDSRDDVTRFVDRADGRFQHDEVLECPHSDTHACSPGYTFQNYWPLDPSRYTREPGIGTFHGRPVIWIAPRQAGGFRASPGEGDRIGLDPRGHEPVAYRQYAQGKLIYETEVLERKPDIPAGKYAFVVPNPTPQLRRLRAEGRLNRAAFSAKGTNPFARRAQHALGGRPLWLGERFDGNRLQAVTIGSTFDTAAGTRLDAAHFVDYDYGTVQIIEYDARALYGQGQGFVPGRVTLLNPDALELTRDGVFVFASKPHPRAALGRAGALRLARALRPVPMP